MTRDGREILHFFIRHAAFGFGLSAVFVTALIWTDVGQLRTLFAASPVGWFAAGLLYFFTGLTFASVQMGMAVMQMGRREDRPPRRPARPPVPIPVAAAARRKAAPGTRA